MSKIKYVCIYCNKSFFDYEKSKRKYCSRICSNSAFPLIDRIKKYVRKSGTKSANWRGGKASDEKGYIRVWTSKNKWAYQHRMIMEQQIGRKLDKNETVHHINGIKSDNRVENLEIISRKNHGYKHIPSKSGQYVSCLRCNTQTYKMPFKLKDGRKLFCSIHCSNLYKKENHCL